MKTLVRTRVVGGSIMVTVPKEVVEVEDIQEGEILEAEFRKIKKSGFGILKGMKPFTKEDEWSGDD